MKPYRPRNRTPPKYPVACIYCGKAWVASKPVPKICPRCRNCHPTRAPLPRYSVSTHASLIRYPWNSLKVGDTCSYRFERALHLRDLAARNLVTVARRNRKNFLFWTNAYSMLVTRITNPPQRCPGVAFFRGKIRPEPL